MAGAMVEGLLRGGQVPARTLACISAADGTGEALAARTGIRLEADLTALLHGAELVVLAIKPQQLKELPPAIGPNTAGKLVLSILAGTPLKRLRERFPQARNIVRAMPNTPGMIGQGITAYAAEQGLSAADQALVEQVLGALGEVVALPETSLDAVTALSGSGPAYVFEFVAALRDAGVAAGLDAETAYRLALHTVRGSAELLKAVPETPETHRNWVSSPGGTTLAGLAVMESGKFRDLMRATVLAAQKRAGELAGS